MQVRITLLSNTGLFGIIQHKETKYFIELGWLDDHIVDNVYLINAAY